MGPLWDTRFELKPDTWVFVPTEETIKIGKEIKHAVERVWIPPQYYFHLRSGGHVRALRSHLHNSLFVHVDIRNFFGSINRTRVTRCLKDLFGYADARKMANVSTVIHPNNRHYILPFGFVQSPVIASLCLVKSALGSVLHEIVNDDNFAVSVYVDDIVLSGNDKELLQQALAKVSTAAERSGLPLNPEKEEGPSAMITAFNVRLSHGKLEIEPGRMAEFLDSYRTTGNERVKDGIHSYVESVNPAQAIAL